MNDKKKIKAFKEYSYEIYKNLDLNSLAAYTIHLLKKESIFLNFENVAVALFLMFPKKFSMVNYEEYPDTNRINRTVNLQLRPKYQNLAFGDPHKGYSLTNKGKAVSEQVESILSKNKKNMKIKKSNIKHDEEKRSTSPEKEVINKITSKLLYKKFLENKNFELTKLEIYEFLSASPYTSKEALRDHYNKLKIIADKAKNKEALEFLNWFKENSGGILKGK